MANRIAANQFLVVLFISHCLLFCCTDSHSQENSTGFHFTQSDLLSESKYEDISIESLYIPMRDGVNIAIDIALPKNLPSEIQIPAVMKMTRYWRASEGSGISGFQHYFASRGYAVITVDARGSGASFGKRDYALHSDEVKDYSEIVDWIIQQPWSNGKVGAYGVSYEGSTAELLAVNNHPAVKAVIPQFNEFDIYTDIVYPGGIFLDAFISQWAEFVYDLDHNNMGNRGVKPVDKRLLKQALKDHENNWNVYETAKQSPFRNNEANGFSYSQISAMNLEEKIESSGAAISAWGSWMDAATADGVIKRFLQFSNSQISVIGPWSHGAGFHASPYLAKNAPTTPDRSDQLKACLQFFDFYLKGINNRLPKKKTLFYYTMGEEKWKSTVQWPPDGSSIQRYFFSENNALSKKIPGSEIGKDQYRVDFSATTGTSNRWHTQLGGGDVFYPDRRQEDEKLLVYTSASLAQDIEITGHPMVSLNISSSETDGAIFVYLEDVNENGKVYYITEGQLRLIHRKISETSTTYKDLIISRDYKQEDAKPLIPDEIYEIRFSLLPTSVLIKKGHRIRIAIAGHDRDTFSRVPESGEPIISVFRNKTHFSYIDLPIVIH